MAQRSLARRHLMPWVSLDAELIGIVKQPHHVFGIELFIVRIVKIRPDVREIEIHPVLPRSLIDPLQIADTLGLNQRTDSPSANAQSVALRIGPLRLQLPVANDIGVKLALIRCSGNSLPIHENARRVKEYLSDYTAVHVHFLKMLAVNIHIDHDG